MATESARQVASRAGGGEATATLEEVDIRAELPSRPRRPVDQEKEDRAFALLAKEMAESPRNMLQKLVEMAVELCRADTAGISLLEGEVFRWEAIAGVFAAARNGTMPRAASPCGVCIDRNSTQLMHLADRCFPALRADPRFVEALLIPFHNQGKPVGTVWIVAHSDQRKFDGGDERVLRVLSQFASVGWQLWKAREAAEEASRHKDEFLAMLAHELRNPLAPIVTAVKLMELRGDASSNRERQVIERQVAHLSRLVNELLDVSRISQGKIELSRRAVDIAEIAAQSVEMASPLFERKWHHLAVDVPKGELFVDGDPVRLAQVIGNLLTNAAKFTPARGKVRLSAVPEGDEVVVRVKDEGIGIAQELLPKVFGLFVQGPRSLDRSEGGLGLGLAVVTNLVALHGGSVSAHSEGPGRGSEFAVRLPMLRIAPPPPPAEKQRPALQRGRRILLVDDNEDGADTLAEALRIIGHDVAVAHNGPDALSIQERFRAEIGLLDLGLPVMDGYELASRLRRISGDALHLVALTGYGDDQDRERTSKAGFDAHLLKPVELDELIALLSSFSWRQREGEAS
jgi:signal transduction histidine kinase/CheY-like chemotaxis protein